MIGDDYGGDDDDEDKKRGCRDKEKVPRDEMCFSDANGIHSSSSLLRLLPLTLLSGNE